MEKNATVFWLKAASAMVIGFGLAIAIAALPVTAEPMRLFTDLVFWPFDGAQSLAAPETRIYCAVCGGVMVGWGVMMWRISTSLYPKEPELARSLILASTFSWFVVDSAASIAAGAPFNAVLNIPFLLIIIAPVWRASHAAASRST
jgi:hypothetical protein